MNVVFPTCCGADVHRSFLVATIIKTPKDSLQSSYQEKRFTTLDGIIQSISWMGKRVDNGPMKGFGVSSSGGVILGTPHFLPLRCENVLCNLLLISVGQF